MKRVLQTVGELIAVFAIFFIVIAFVVTCTFMVFSTAVKLPETDVRAFAPVVFVNVIILTVIFTAADIVRRKVTVDRPVREIQKTLKRLTEGDFTARVSLQPLPERTDHFRSIAESVNRLAEELGGVETLRTDFVANVSHELKTPLAVMGNYASMLRRPGLTEAERMEYAKAISDTSRRLATLITNILKLNRLENQQIFPGAEEYDLGEQLCECLLQFEEQWERIELETDITESVIVRSDPELLSLVWNNLISNAVKFTPDGGRVSVSLKIDGDRVSVRISDTGCGMSPEVGAHIFEKFYQGDTSHAAQGNGLGLALVKRVIDIMRGEISVESAPGAGSSFTVRLRRQ